MRIYFYASVEIDEETLGDWETEAEPGDDLTDLVADELTSAAPNLSIYIASRAPF